MLSDLDRRDGEKLIRLLRKRAQTWQDWTTAPTAKRNTIMERYNHLVDVVMRQETEITERIWNEIKKQTPGEHHDN